MNKEKTIAVIIAAHKEYRMPEDPIYVPLHVGACKDQISDPATEDAKRIAAITGAEGTSAWDASYEKDDTGDNISYLNPSFCELTGMYWAWKNLQADYLGLVHYRRHFCLQKKGNLFDSILTGQELMPLLDDYDVFVPRKRKYYIESLYSHYAHTHFAVQLDASREMIEKNFPDYLPAYDKVIKQTWGYMFNMMILKRDLFDDYCSWLFTILFVLKEELGAKMIETHAPAAESFWKQAERDEPVLSDFQSRFYGRISEILFNVWLEKKLEEGTLSPKRIKELGFLNLEGENWTKKGTSFLKAKFFGKKYEKSF